MNNQTNNSQKLLEELIEEESKEEVFVFTDEQNEEFEFQEIQEFNYESNEEIESYESQDISGELGDKSESQELQISSDKIDEKLEIDTAQNKEESILLDSDSISSGETYTNNSGNASMVMSRTRVDGSVVLVNVDAQNDDTKFICVICGRELDANKFGKLICVCGMINYRTHQFPLRTYESLDGQEEKEYKKLIAHINNKFKDRNYILAYKLCLQAEELAPGESTTWEYFSLAILYLARYVEKKPTLEIIRNIKIQLSKCKSYNIGDPRYEEVSGYIANELFYREKTRLNAYRPIIHKTNKDKIWKHNVLSECFNSLKCIEMCYFSLNQDVRFLEVCVNELSRPYKWLVKDIDGDIKNMPACGKINAAAKRVFLIAEIKKTKSEYQPPEIETERIIFGIEEAPSPDQIIFL